MANVRSEARLEVLLAVIGDCAVYKLRAADEVAKHKGCSRQCKVCQRESKAWLLKEAE